MESHKNAGNNHLSISIMEENDYERAYGWKGNTIYESEMALFFECMQ
jgi:hypothetical protein